MAASLIGLLLLVPLQLGGSVLAEGERHARSASTPGAPADLVLTGGAVYTMDAARSWAEAVAVRDGRVVFVGTDIGAKSWIGPRTRVLRLEGRLLLPAFQDAHVHPVTSGVELGQCALAGLDTRELILERVKACAVEQAGKPWVMGGGWALPAFAGGAPSRADLDAIVPDRPAFLVAADGHSAWANTKAFEAAGVTASTPDPPHGRIERDTRTGAPAGTLRESAIDLLARLAPTPTLEEKVAGLRRALRVLNGLGITAVQEASATEGILEAYREAEKRGVLTARVVAALETKASAGPEQVDRLVALRRAFASRRLRPVAAKIFMDGVIEARTAAMLEPYVDRPGQAGEPILSPDRLDVLVARLADAGFSVHVHAIGDRAVRLALDAFAAARGRAPAATLRHQIAHLEVIHPDDVPRFRALRVIANFQPLWAFADSYITDLTWPALGPARSRRLYPIAELARSGAILAFGSDWSVSSANPLEGIQVAVTRQAVSGKRGEPMLPEQALDLPTALAAYTIGAAYANALEAETGSIEVGKFADLVVLSADLFALDPHDLAKARVLLTLLEGEPVFRDPTVVW